MEVISLQESKRLTQLEEIIKEGELKFIQVGEALAEIRDKKLYRADYGTFETYCREVWGWGSSRARQICLSAEAAKSVNSVNAPPLTARAAQALSSVPPTRRAGIVQKIVNAGQKVTAAAVSKLAPKRPTASATGFLDATGLEVPAECLPLWKRLSEVQELLCKVSDLRGSLRKAQDGDDILFSEVDFTDNLAKLSQVFLDLQRAKPYAVCTTCAGVNPDGCLTCNGRGFVSQFYWEHCVPIETKQLTGRK